MDAFKRSRDKLRSLPRRLASTIRSISSEYLNHPNHLLNTPTLPRRRNGISFDSYNDLRKIILNAPLPTTVLQHTPTKEFSLNGNDLPIASSSYYILTSINQCSTLILFNKDNELKRIDLSHSLIYFYDLCWSIKLNMFLMAGYSLYTFDPRSCKVSIIENIELARGDWIVSITTNNNSIYLLYSCSNRIECRSILYPHNLEKQWSQKYFLQKKDFLAQSIRINDWNILALTIKQKNREWRVDLFDSNNFKRINRSCSLGQGIPGMRNCLIIPYDRLWIVINNCSLPKQIILLDENGEIKEKPYIDESNGFINLCLIENEWIAMNSKNKLQLYKI
ncbi:unnamed protein product [Adineta steineri]|uniref:Uncharacterized protein n=3 Tax=Adineta steineri TaxID=433720 RepID=A0A815JD77_9BILA|nr:unnamed protein product [Adineta steineri]